MKKYLIFIILLMIIFMVNGCCYPNSFAINNGVVPSNSYYFHNPELNMEVYSTAPKYYSRRYQGKDFKYIGEYMKFNKRNYIYPNARELLIVAHIKNLKKTMYNVWKVQETYKGGKRHYTRKRIYHGRSSKRIVVKCPRYNIDRGKTSLEIRDQFNYLYFMIGELKYIIRKGDSRHYH